MSLSPRQTEVADLLCEGLPQKQVADQLHISRSTALRHVDDIHRTTGAHNSVELFWWMLRHRQGRTFQEAKRVVNFVKVNK